MFVTVSQSQLARALSVVSRAVAPRSTLPITGHILLATKPGKLKLAATNLDLAIVTLIDAEVKEEGGMSVPARLFADLVSSLPDGQVELRRPKKTPELSVSAPRAEASVKGLDASEFPAIDASDAVVLYRVPAAALRQAIDDVIFAAAKDQTRPQLSGLLLRAEGTVLTVVGCDSFRLSVRRVALTAPACGNCPDLIIPRTTMLEAARGFGSLEEPVRIAATPTRGQVVFATSSLQLTTRVIDGAYVDFERVLGQSAQHDIRISTATADLLRAARFSAIVARDDSNALRIAVTPGLPTAATPAGGQSAEGTLVFQAAAQVGENTTEVAARITGPATSLTLDNSYLADVLGAIRSTRLMIGAASGKTLPLLVQPEGADDTQHVIMPLHRK
jgi:DNA polymerase-3 subunit beta